VGDRKRWTIFVGLLCLTFASYAPVFHAGYVWDDDAWLTGNPAVADPQGLHAIWTSVPRMQYYPLLFTSYWVEYRLWGLQPLGYHVVNLLLHATNAFLVGLVLVALEIPGAWWVAAVFAVHPMHVESVAWVTERKNVLSGAFALGSTLLYLRRRSFAALALFSGALLSKTATATLPVALGIVDAWKSWPPRWKTVTPLAPFVALAGAMALVTIALEKGMVDVVGTDFVLSPWHRVLVASRGLLFYPFKLLVPYPTIFNYPRFDVEHAGATALGAPTAVVLAAVGLAYLWKRGMRGPACAALAYAVLIFPVLGFFDVYAFRFSFVADHFGYLASIPILALFPWIGTWIPSREVLRGLAVASVVVLAVLTFRQAGAYHDEATLWRDTIAKNPDSWIAHHNLATTLSKSKQLDAAIAEFGEALRCKPASAESYTGRGLAYLEQGRADLALPDLDRAVQLDPSYPQAYLNRGDALSAAGRPGDAIPDFDRFLSTNPGYALAYRSRAMAYVQLGRDQAALDDLTRAVMIEPSSAELLTRRAFVEIRMTRHDAALADLDAAARLDPSLAITYVLRGGVYRRLDANPTRACEEWRTACRLGNCQFFDAECRGR
jgi:tetratricopeptide (TPR) repeat protein